MKKYLSSFLLIIITVSSLLVFSACRDKYEDCTDSDYDNCNTIRPDVGYVSVSLTINEENPAVVVAMYEGDFENGELVWETIVRESTQSFEILTDREYSFTAVYQKDGEIVIAVDGGKLKVISYQACEFTCYDLNELSIDLTLE